MHVTRSDISSGLEEVSVQYVDGNSYQGHIR